MQPRENHERAFPLATLRPESRGMLQDRSTASARPLHDPCNPRHVVGLPRILSLTGTGDAWRLKTEANCAVFRTKLDDPSSVFNAGRHLDTIVRTPDGLKFADRLCVYDSEMLPNVLIYPIDRKSVV